MATATNGVTVSHYVSPWHQWPAGKSYLTYSFQSSAYDNEWGYVLGQELIEPFRRIVREAMDAWEKVCGVRFIEQFSFGSPRPSDIYIAFSKKSDGSGNVLASAWTATGGDDQIFAVGIGFDPAEPWGNTLFFDAALHELGHALGLEHSDIPGAVMSGPPTTQYARPPGRDVLQPDDIAAAQALFGPPGQEVFSLIGSADADTLAGAGGNDTIKGGFGNDTIEGGAGDDVLAGNGVYWTHWDNPQDGYWSRTFDGSTDRDSINGGAGNDFINGNAGADFLEGGPGNDTIFGGQNEGTWQPGKTRTNTTHLREGHDTLRGGEGDDWLNGNMGTDVLHGGAGNDVLHGGQDEDLLYGEEGDDTLWGDLEGDTIYGGPGNDHIVTGNDTGSGDGAVDHVHIGRGEAVGDVIYGFEAHDILWIDGAIGTRAQAEAIGVVFVTNGI